MNDLRLDMSRINYMLDKPLPDEEGTPEGHPLPGQSTGMANPYYP